MQEILSRRLFLCDKAWWRYFNTKNRIGRLAPCIGESRVPPQRVRTANVHGNTFAPARLQHSEHVASALLDVGQTIADRYCLYVHTRLAQQKREGHQVIASDVSVNNYREALGILRPR
jgi:hypothetical protein